MGAPEEADKPTCPILPCDIQVSLGTELERWERKKDPSEVIAIHNLHI